jgi:hypothetical protein
MAGCSQAPVLILAAPDALTPPIAVAVGTAAAKRERGRTADDRVAEIITTPSNFIESSFIVSSFLTNANEFVS